MQEQKERRRQAGLTYKHRKTQMGVFTLSFPDGQTFIGYSKDIPAMVNGIRFKLGANMHPNGRLQKTWNERGGNVDFQMQVQEELPYDADHPERLDYQDDLKLLSLCWQEKMPEAIVL